MKPHGAVCRLTKNFEQIATFEGSKALDEYLASEECRQLLILASPSIRKSYEKARKRCQSGVTPKGTRRAQWDPRMVVRLREALERHDGDMALAARDLHVTKDAAQRAFERHIAVCATEKPARSPQESREFRGHQTAIRSETASQAANAGPQ